MFVIEIVFVLKIIVLVYDGIVFFGYCIRFIVIYFDWIFSDFFFLKYSFGDIIWFIIVC